MNRKCAICNEDCEELFSKNLSDFFCEEHWNKGKPQSIPKNDVKREFGFLA